MVSSQEAVKILVLGLFPDPKMGLGNQKKANLVKMEKHNLYIKISRITKKSLEKAPNLDLLPIFLDSDLRSNHLVSCYHKTAIHFYDLGPSRYLTSRFRAGLSLEDFKEEYFTELLSKDWIKIFNKLSFLKDLSGAVGIVFMTGIENPEFIDIIVNFLNNSGFLEDPIKELI